MVATQADLNATIARRWTRAEAFEFCRKLACSHYENFPVGSLVVPKSIRRHFYSIYSFARIADDFADEGSVPVPERLHQIAQWRAALERCVNLKGDFTGEHPVFIALAETIDECQLPLQLFHDLLDAFTLDVKRSRHETFEDLLDYCRCSANPVGRLILLLFGHREEPLHKMSDGICSALQLTNFWQDILVDLAKDRIYLPQKEMAKFGYSEQDLHAKVYNKQYLAMLESLDARTEELFQFGKPLCNKVGGRLGFELRLVWLGGTNLLNALRQQQYNVFAHRPTIGTSRKLAILLKALRPGSF